VTSGHISFALSGSLFAPSPADLEVHYRVVPEGTIADALPTYTATIVSHTDTSITFEANPEYTFVNSPSSFQAAVRSYQGYSNWETVAEVEPANSTGAIAGGVVGGLVAVVIIALVIVFLVLRRHRGDIKGSRTGLDLASIWLSTDVYRRIGADLEVPEDMAHIFNIKSTDLEIISKLGEGRFASFRRETFFIPSWIDSFSCGIVLALCTSESFVRDSLLSRSLLAACSARWSMVRLLFLFPTRGGFS
jgi:hypothetical protein